MPDTDPSTHSVTYSFTHNFWVQAYPILKGPPTILIAFFVTLIAITVSLLFNRWPWFQPIGKTFLQFSVNPDLFYGIKPLFYVPKTLSKYEHGMSTFE